MCCASREHIEVRYKGLYMDSSIAAVTAIGDYTRHLTCAGLYTYMYYTNAMLELSTVRTVVVLASFAD
jgi:hypothetical protein